jgi:hypothetical protein
MKYGTNGVYGFQKRYRVTEFRDLGRGGSSGNIRCRLILQLAVDRRLGKAVAILQKPFNARELTKADLCSAAFLRETHSDYPW